MSCGNENQREYISVKYSRTDGIDSVREFLCVFPLNRESCVSNKLRELATTNESKTLKSSKRLNAGGIIAQTVFIIQNFII